MYRKSMTLLIMVVPIRALMQILDDPSGNSFVENPLAPNIDHCLTMDRYNRTREQEIQLGMISNSTDVKVQV